MLYQYGRKLPGAPVSVKPVAGRGVQSSEDDCTWLERPYSLGETLLCGVPADMAAQGIEVLVLLDRVVQERQL